MKRKYYLLFFLIFIITAFAFIFNEYSRCKYLKEEKAKDTYWNRKAEFNAIVRNQKAFLHGIGAFLVSSKLIKDAYKNNNRKQIIELVQPLWNELKERKVIREIHFFKFPVINYIDFSALKSYGQNVSKARNDIQWIESSFTSSEYFFVCKTFPGYRVTYPIVENGVMLGSISLGIDIRDIANIMKTTNATDTLVVLDDNILKTKLVSSAYKKLLLSSYMKKGNLYCSEKKYNFTLDSGYELIDDQVYSKFKIIDFEKKLIGYLVVVDDLHKEFNTLKRYAYFNILLQLLILFLQFIVLIFIFSYLVKRVNIIEKIVGLIKERKFPNLPKLSDKETLFGKLENNVIEMGQELYTYITILSKQVQDFETKAYLDSLTGAFNRHALDELGENIFKKSKISNEALSLILFDVDNFKIINDTYGHSVGDIVLQQLVRQIKKSLRESDILVRYGGEEFLIILPAIQVANAYEIAKKLLEEVRKLNIEIDDHIIQFTISVGLTNLQEEDISIYDLIKRADAKLYRAKTTGKDKVEI